MQQLDGEFIYVFVILSTREILEIAILEPNDSLYTSDAAHAYMHIKRLHVEKDALVIQVIEE